MTEFGSDDVGTVTEGTGKPTYVAVVGPGDAEGEVVDQAEEIGRLLAWAGVTMICGGLGGAMEAACRGARSGGGATVGILPGVDRSEANPWVTIAIPTGMGEMRNALVVRASDAVIAVGGEYGTLSEVALALKLGLPVVGLGTWGLVRPDGRQDRAITTAVDPLSAVAEVLRRLRADA